MAGFLSQDQINKVQNLMSDLHTTFARTITVYKNSKKTLIASSNSWNSLYRRTNTGSNSSVEYTTVSSTFEARIYYDDMDTSILRMMDPLSKQEHKTKLLFQTGPLEL